MKKNPFSSFSSLKEAHLHQKRGRDRHRNHQTPAQTCVKMKTFLERGTKERRLRVFARERKTSRKEEKEKKEEKTDQGERGTREENIALFSLDRSSSEETQKTFPFHS